MRQLLANESNEPEELIDENYDPSEFLLEKFHKSVPMSEEDDDEDEDTIPPGSIQVATTKMTSSSIAAEQENHHQSTHVSINMDSQLITSTSQGQHVQFTHLEAELAVSDSSEEEKMQIDGQSKSNDEPNDDDDDVWF